MPRKWIEAIHPYPPPNAREGYLLRVTGIDKCAEPPAIRVQLEFLQADQAGRTHIALLPLPIRPAGLTFTFIQACGLAARGNTVAPNDALGKTVRAHFAPAAETADWQIVGFAADARMDAGGAARRQSQIGEDAES
jgi:hypothetical protein